jgi:hypothetical protein
MNAPPRKALKSARKKRCLHPGATPEVVDGVSTGLYVCPNCQKALSYADLIARRRPKWLRPLFWHRKEVMPKHQPVRIPLPPDEAVSDLLKVKVTKEMPRPGARKPTKKKGKQS